MSTPSALLVIPFRTQKREQTEQEKQKGAWEINRGNFKKRVDETAEQQQQQLLESFKKNLKSKTKIEEREKMGSKVVYGALSS